MKELAKKTSGSPNERQLAVNTLEVIISNCRDIFPGDLLELKDTLELIRGGGKFSPEHVVTMSRNALMDQAAMSSLLSDPQFMEALESTLLNSQHARTVGK